MGSEQNKTTVKIFQNVAFVGAKLAQEQHKIFAVSVLSLKMALLPGDRRVHRRSLTTAPESCDRPGGFTTASCHTLSGRKFTLLDIHSEF